MAHQALGRPLIIENRWKDIRAYNHEDDKFERQGVCEVMELSRQQVQQDMDFNKE